MDACLSCFGLGRSSDGDDDQEPLLSNQDHRAQVNGAGRPTTGSYGTVPLSSGTSQDHEPHVANPILEKVVDIVAAFKAGKLPTQNQIARILQLVLTSDLLKDGLDQGSRLAGSRDGTGPTSLRGVRALQDFRAVIQAVLEFSVEKNDDNKIQDFFHQLSLLNAKGVEVDFDFDPSGLPSFKVAEATQAAMTAGKESVSAVQEEVPQVSEVADDSAIFAQALRTILQTILTSTIFRYLLIDALGILRDLAVQGATDVQKAASYVGSVAAGLEKNLNEADMDRTLDETVEGIQHVTADKILGEGRKAYAAASEATEAAKRQVSEKAAEWDQRRAGALNEAGDDIIARIQQVLEQAQEDPASQRAMRALLMLARKYSEKLEAAGDAIADATAHAVEEVVGAAAPSKDDETPDTTGGFPATTESTSNPPPSSATPLSASALPRVHVQTSKDKVDDPIRFALLELKGMFERMARGHSLDGALQAFINVMNDLKELPVELGETVIQEVDQKGKAKLASDSKPPSTNVFRAYLTRIGRYMDKAMDHPGWVTSPEGNAELERLFMEGFEILNVVEEVVEDVGGVAAGVQDTSGLSSEGEDHAKLVRQQFARHVRLFWSELEMFLGDLEKDRTTTRLWQSTNALANSIADLISSGPASVHARMPTSTSLISRIRSSLVWTEWAAWALPRLIHLIPLSAIPIPSLEARSETGGWQAGLYALFVKGAVARSRARMGRISNPADYAVLGGIQTTLIPDQIVFKEWTEVRIDMADEVGNGGIATGAQPQGSRWQNAIVDTTSRIRLHIDGIRARIDGLGYYLQYGGSDSWIGYEDEGILSVDLGMGYPHAGLGCDIEIEVTKGSGGHQHRTLTTQEPLIAPSALAGEGIEGEGEMATVTDIFLDETALGGPQQGQGAETVVPGRAAIETPGGEELEPSFKVVNVQVQMEGVRVELQKSRHWILNKLLIQPLAGPTVHQVARLVLADKLKEGLQSIALELAKISSDANAHAKRRRENTRRRKHEARVRRIENLIHHGHRGIEPYLVAPYEEKDDSFWDVVGDWSHAVVDCGSRLVAPKEDVEEEAAARVDTGVEATLQGVIIHSSTAVVGDTANPDDVPPPMVFNKQERKMEPTGSSIENANGGGSIVDVSDMTIAVGGGAQLFPDKQVPYGEDNDAAPIEGTLLDRTVKAAAEATAKVEDTARTAVTVADQVEARYEEDLRRERGSGWTSKAFDF